MLQVPAETKVRAPPLVMVQTPVVVELKVGARPELAVALRVGVLPKIWAPGLAKLMVWAAGFTVKLWVTWLAAL